MILNLEVKVFNHCRSTWNSLEKGLKDDIFATFLSEIEQLEWDSQYNLYVVGGLLADRPTNDIDLVLTGPFNRKIIHKILYSLLKIGFDIGTWVDVKYHKEPPITYQQWVDKGKVASKTVSYAIYNELILGGKSTLYNRKKDGILYKSDQYLPKPKVIEELKKNPALINKLPIKIK